LQKKLKRIKPTVIPGILWLIVITFLLILPGSSFPKQDWFSKIWFDKWVHIGFFAVLVFLWCWSFTKFPAKKLFNLFVITALLGLAYGIGMEFIQKYFIVNRSFDLGDIIADAIGSGIGFIFSWYRYIKI
jgi:VanZ family protein